MADSYTIGQERTAGGTATILHISGELDINSRDDLREAILAALGHGNVTIDLDGVTFVDSEALGALIEGYNAAQRIGAVYRAVHAHGLVERVLAVSGARDLFGA